MAVWHQITQAVTSCVDWGMMQVRSSWYVNKAVGNSVNHVKFGITASVL